MNNVMQQIKIIVLTPIKNEAWIIEQFLLVTSLFADHIIIADQQSTDESKNICEKFSKVTVIENNKTDYNEAERQMLLIETARRMYPDYKRILFCLDADELITASSLEQKDAWERINQTKEGTVFYFEKPDILPQLHTCCRWREGYFPIAFVDDGTIHNPREVHSTRIPTTNKIHQRVDEIKFMHFAHTRMNVQSSKLRYYSVVENIKNSSPLHLRRYHYQSFFNLHKSNPLQNIEETPSEWMEEYNRMNIALKNLPDPMFSWHDYEVLRYFKESGYARFYWEDIWEFNWEKCRLHALNIGNTHVPTTQVKNPPITVKLLGKALSGMHYLLRYMKGRLNFKK